MAIEFNRTRFSKSDLLEIQRDLTLTVTSNNGASSTRDYIFDFDKDNIRLPFAYGRKFAGPPEPFDVDGPANGFEGELRDQQKIISGKALQTLSESGSVIVSAFTGAGKTVTSLQIACVLGKKTLIMTNKKMLISQWEESINKFCPSMPVQVLVPKKTIKCPTTRFFIVNPINIPKFPKEFFNDMDTLIVDELHQIMSKKSLRNFFHVYPSYLIGLSATPIRYDSYDKCITIFFGTRQVGVELMKKHHVYTIKTGYMPPMISTPNGLDWNAVLDGQSMDADRNLLICDIISKLSSRNWLVLVKRVVHAENLATILNQRGIPCELLVGNKREYDRNCKVLIGTIFKVGVGFDNPNIDALFVATDIQAYFIQSLGRCMRRPDVRPIIVDLVDAATPLVKHFRERLKVYRDHGGAVRELNLDTI